MRLALIVLVALPIVAALVLAGMIAFGTAPDPPPVESLQVADAAIGHTLADLPPVRHFKARDGAQLAYRLYPAAPERVAILIHGSSGSSTAVHAFAKSMQAAGITVLAPDMRGHGQSGPHGDIGYIGQLEDDIVDLAATLPQRRPNDRRLMVGHSSGGGFALRFDAGPYGENFDGYVLLAPYLGFDAPTVRPGTGGWAVAYTPRIIALSILARLHIDWFQSLPVIAFAILPEARSAARTQTYSFRLAANFGPHRDWRDDLRHVRRPTAVVVDADDELFFADKFEPTIHALRPDIAVTIVPGLKHMGLVIDPAGWAAAIQAFSALAVEKP